MLTQEKLKELFRYDPETGNLIWRVRNSNRIKIGAVAGTLTNYGYVSISIEGERHLAHRLIWLLHNGRWPSGEIDHANLIKTDNRIENLRDATHGENARNRPAQSNSSSKIKGVCWDSRHSKWLVQVSSHGKKRHIGRFNTLDEAEAAARLRREELHGEFVNHGGK